MTIIQDIVGLARVIDGDDAKRWEYLRVPADTNNSLTQLGKEGWELIAVEPDLGHSRADNYNLLFKRLKS